MDDAEKLPSNEGGASHDENGSGTIKDLEKLERLPTATNKVDFAFVMTMLGFSMTFVCAEVIPLFLITLFTIIAYDLGASDKVIWCIVSQIIAVAAVAPFVGNLSDLLGRKIITLVSLGLTVVAMILIGTTPNVTGFIAGQVLSGIAIGIQLLTAIAAVTELVPISQRGITIGYVVLGFMPFAAASLYGQLIAEHNWRWVALFVGIWAVMAFVIILIFYRPPPRTNSTGLTKRQILGRMDFFGGFLATAGVVVFLVGLNWGGQDYPWSSGRVIACLVVGIVLMIAFFVWEKFGTKHPLFPARLAQHTRIFAAISFLCVTSGINFIPGIIFWVVQVYTVYEKDFTGAGVALLPIGFCIAGGAIISAVAMTVLKNHIHLVLLGFCIVQTAGLGSLAAADPDNINTVWAPLILGLIGVGGVLLPSQVIFSIISPEELIGTSVALSVVIRAIGQSIGVSMFYNIFQSGVTNTVMGDETKYVVPLLPYIYTPPPAGSNIVGQDLVDYIQNQVTFFYYTLTAGPLSNYAYLFPNIKTPETTQMLQDIGKEVYKHAFPKLYLVSIAWGGAAIIACFFIRDVRKYINENVSVHL